MTVTVTVRYADRTLRVEVLKNAPASCPAVLTLMGHGRSNAELAQTLTLSEATVKTHVASNLRQTEPPRPRTGRRPGLRDRPRHPGRSAIRVRGTKDIGAVQG